MIAQVKSKKQIYLKKLNKLAIFSNFLVFLLFLFEKFTLLDPDPVPQPCCKV